MPSVMHWQIALLCMSVLLDESGTPLKGAAIISFQSDGNSVTSTLIDVVTQLP